MSKVIRQTKQISVITEERGFYNVYILRINGIWENEYNSLEELTKDFQSMVMGVYKYD